MRIIKVRKRALALAKTRQVPKRVLGKVNVPRRSQKKSWISTPSIYGPVKKYDVTDPLGEFSPEFNTEIAVSLDGPELQTIECPGVSNFSYGQRSFSETVSGGKLHLPVGGMKALKNTRKAYMLFFVFSGEVEVEVNGNKFRICKGGIW